VDFRLQAAADSDASYFKLAARVTRSDAVILTNNDSDDSKIAV
jgi:hypothetical protein